MSWAEEDWTVGLSGLALRKVKELQVQQERLQREKQQKQLQLDSSQTALHKQTVMHEEVRGELLSVQRDLQVAWEEAQAGAGTRERLLQELQVKQAQVCSLEGQLDSSRAHAHTLAQEVKRLEAELEKLQNSSSSGDSILFSTPCWNMTSPWDHNEGKPEDRLGHRGDGDSKALHVRQQLQFSDSPKPLPSFPRQLPKSTPHRHPSHQLDSSAVSSVFPWERGDPQAAERGRPTAPSSPAAPSADVIRRGQDSGDYGKEDKLEKRCVSELQSRVCVLEAELCAEAERLRQTQDQLTQTRRDLGSREHSLQKARDELSLAHTRISQESDRVSSAEQRQKQLQEELKCQRQNTETSRVHAQQRTRDLEKQHQRDVLELQKERQSLEKQHQQEVNKLNQEIQQARTLHNALQAQFEKLSLQKQAVEREVEGLKEKLRWSEGELKDSKKMEAQTQAKLTEAQREAEGLSVTLEQSRRKAKGLEEEVKRLTQDLADALRLLKELQDQQAASVVPVTPVHFSPSGQSFAPLPSPHHARLSSHTLKKLARAERGREGEEDLGDRGDAGWKASYPSEREPGEGIDAEHISSFGSAGVEEPRRAGERVGEKAGQEERQRGEPSPETLVEDAQDKPHRVHTAHPDPKSPSGSYTDHPGLDDLRRENAALRSELRDVKEELAKRLEDLESQRRAEAETRTRLKQLSRKHAAQAEHGREREEQDRERKRELEEERAEKESLKQAVVALEAKVKREREEMVRRERERDHEDRESECIELNIQLKKQLAEVKTLLAHEREEREKEDERKRMKKKGMEGTGDLTLKLTELEAELEELKNRGSVEGKNSNERNSPLTYLTLQSDINSNSNIISDTKLLPSPDQHRLFCESSNQQNMAVSLATAATDLIQKDAHLTKLPELSIPTIVAQTTLVAKKGLSTSNLEETTCEALRGESFNQPDLAETAVEAQVESNTDLEETTKDPWEGICASELAQELERLRGENAREAAQARQTQAKLEALQNQVTCQTRQLTLAFDKQSQHIVDLLAELQLKEGALFSQGGELQRCREELASLTAPRQKEQEEKDAKKREEEEGEKNPETPEEEEEEEAAEGEEGGEVENQKQDMKLDNKNIIQLQPNPPEEHAIKSADLPTATQQQSVSKGDACLTRTEDSQRQDVVEEAFAKELLTLKQENRQLKMRLQALEASDGETRSPVIDKTPSDSIEDPDRTPVEERAGNDLTSSPMELKGERLIEGVSDITPSLKSALQDEEEPKDEMREDRKIQGEGETVSEEETHSDMMTQPQVNCLQQQLVALQAHLQILSEEHQKQAEELALWRLTTNELTQVQMPCLGQDQTQEQATCLGQDQTQEQATCLGQKGHLVLGGSPSSVTVIREDELLLSCSSSRLYGRTLGSRIQPCTSPERSPLQSSPRRSSSGPQEQMHQSSEEDEDEANHTTAVPKEARSSSGHQVKALGLADTDESRPRGQTQTKEVEPRENASHPPSDMEAHSTQSLSLENQTAPDQCNTKQQETISVSDLVVDVNHLSSSHSNLAQTTTTMVSTLESQTTTVEPVQLEGQRSELSRGITPQISTSVFPSGMSGEKYPAEGEGDQGSKFTKAAKKSDALEKVSQMEVRSTAIQTEEGSATPPTPHELHHASTQTEEEEDEEELVDSPPLSPIPPAKGCDRLLFSGSFPIPSDPARLAERIRRSRSQLSAAYDDTEYEPYGLPEVVMKGFADIPSGPACPYIVRRGLLGTPAVPLPPKEPGPKEGGRGRPKQP